ncbi:MAG: hypothetical protein QOF48_3470 [Verrucomicrobiota bacterium]|jgi:hypothetical protein
MAGAGNIFGVSSFAMTKQLHFRAAALWLALLAMTPSRMQAREGITEIDRAHWAFQKVQRPSVPEITDGRFRVQNEVDAFHIAELKVRGLEPGKPADKITLLRRVSLDLIGLPPGPAEIDDFLGDDSPGAFGRVVDRLLASPYYGERWARHWLDLARYAESEGFKNDETRPNAWRYRDYVIKSFNADKPYDRFFQEQIAGDELWPGDADARVATAFNRHYADESNARNLMQRRQEILNDITDTVGGVFLGMTYACARCHDHKFEPISQADYYRLQAFFANTAARDDISLLTPAEAAQHRAQLALWEEKTRDIRARMEQLEGPKRRALEIEYFDKYPEEIQAAWRKTESARTPFERQMVWKARQYLDPKSHEYVGDQQAVVGKFKPDEKKRWLELKKQLDEFADLNPGRPPTASGMADLGPEAPGTFVLFKGAYDKPQAEVVPGLLQILPTRPASPAPSASRETTGRRATLAGLLTDPGNPLTARVMVNRVWQYHFGRGLVGTPSDFGLKGERPTHPQLLDWLTSEFTAQNWSLKKLHRLILMSAAYQQSSAHRPDGGRLDPENKLLWKFPRQRLEGEVIRDASLAVAGMLNSKMGGPSIFPELPAGMPSPRGGWKVSEQEEANRRSVYVFVRRNTRYPMFDSFDMPDPHESCPRRNVTTSPIQALTLLNSHLTLRWAQGFAGRILDIAGRDRDRQIDTAYRLAYARIPDRGEREIANDFFKSHRRILADREKSSHSLVLPPLVSEDADRIDAATLVDFCHMLMNANEFVYAN